MTDNEFTPEQKQFLDVAADRAAKAVRPLAVLLALASSSYDIQVDAYNKLAGAVADLIRLMRELDDRVTNLEGKTND